MVYGIGLTTKNHIKKGPNLSIWWVYDGNMMGIWWKYDGNIMKSNIHRILDTLQKKTKNLSWWVSRSSHWYPRIGTAKCMRRPLIMKISKESKTTKSFRGNLQSIDLPMKKLVILTIVNDSSPWLMVNILLMLVNDDGYYMVNDDW